MAVTKAEKEQELQELTAAFNASDTAILVDYRGLDVPAVTELRRQIRGAKAQYKGTGDLNGVPGYGFLLTATDGQLSGAGVDKFRIKITTSGGVVVYDNNPGPDDIDTSGQQNIQTGSIVIHSK